MIHTQLKAISFVKVLPNDLASFCFKQFYASSTEILKYIIFYFFDIILVVVLLLSQTILFIPTKERMILEVAALE